MENLFAALPRGRALRGTAAASARLAAENLTANADVVHRIADELLSREHIEGEELAALLAGAEPA